MVRPEPLPPQMWPDELQDAISALGFPDEEEPDPDAPQGLNTLGIFAHHPALARAFFTFSGHVMMASTLTPRQRELVTLRVAAVQQCDYEWAQHVLSGRVAGLTDEEIARIAFGPTAPFWSPFDATLLRAVDELLAGGAVSDPTLTALGAEFGPAQLMDLIFTVGSYLTTAFLLRSFAVPLDDDLRP